MTWGTFNKKDSLAESIAKKLSVTESIKASDYEPTSEPSQFGGHRPKVVHKETGKVMHLSQHAYKKPEDAKKHASVYLHAYANVGANHASEQGFKHAQANKDKQYTKEDAEQELDTLINEVLSKDQDAGKWIDDFVKSDNPKFAGKSPEKRKQMALAAYYAAQKKESTDYESFLVLDEATQGEIVKMGAKEIKHANMKDKQDEAEVMEPHSEGEADFLDKHSVNVTDDPTQGKFDAGKTPSATKPAGKGAGKYDGNSKLSDKDKASYKEETSTEDSFEDTIVEEASCTSKEAGKKTFRDFKKAMK